MSLAETLKIQIGRKLSDKSKDEIMKAIFDCFSLYGVIAVQIGYNIVQVTFTTDVGFKHARENSGVRLFGLWCPIVGGGPLSPLSISLTSLSRKTMLTSSVSALALVKSRASKNRSTSRTQTFSLARDLSLLPSLLPCHVP